MRDIERCLLFYPDVLEPLFCSFPEEEKCGRYTKIILRKKGLRTGITLCKYRCQEIGRKNCIQEQLKLKDSTIMEVKRNEKSRYNRKFAVSGKV